MRSLWLCALVLSVFVITIVEEAVGTMLCGQHEIEIIIINCLFLSHPSISGFRSSLCAVVLDGPRRFSLIWYLALLSWLSIVWFFGTVGGYLRGNSVQIYSHRPHDACADRKFRLVSVGDLSSAYQTGDSTTDIRSNGSRKYQQARQKRKLIDASN